MLGQLGRAALVAAFGVAAASAAAQGTADANTQKIFKGYSLNQLTAAGLLYNPQAKAAYHKALGPLVKEPWLSKLDGPSNEFRPVKVAGADFMLGSTCKNRDCYDNTVVLLWAAPDVIYGKVVQKGKSTLIGSPPPAVAAELEKFWKAEFRSQPK
jgi:Inhibitor of vertebrate lysozyme (Ivy)